MSNFYSVALKKILTLQTLSSYKREISGSQVCLYAPSPSEHRLSSCRRSNEEYPSTGIPKELCMKNGPQKEALKNSPGIPHVVHSSKGGPSLKLPSSDEHNSVGIALEEFCRNSSWGIPSEFCWKKVSMSVGQTSSQQNSVNLYSYNGSAPDFYSHDEWNETSCLKNSRIWACINCWNCDKHICELRHWFKLLSGVGDACTVVQ